MLWSYLIFIEILWGVTPYSLVGGYQYVEEPAASMEATGCRKILVAVC